MNFEVRINLILYTVTRIHVHYRQAFAANAAQLELIFFFYAEAKVYRIPHWTNFKIALKIHQNPVNHFEVHRKQTHTHTFILIQVYINYNPFYIFESQNHDKNGITMKLNRTLIFTSNNF